MTSEICQLRLRLDHSGSLKFENFYVGKINGFGDKTNYLSNRVNRLA